MWGENLGYWWVDGWMVSCELNLTITTFSSGEVGVAAISVRCQSLLWRVSKIGTRNMPLLALHFLFSVVNSPLYCMKFMIYAQLLGISYLRLSEHNDRHLWQSFCFSIIISVSMTTRVFAMVSYSLLLLIVKLIELKMVINTQDNYICRIVRPAQLHTPILEFPSRFTANFHALIQALASKHWWPLARCRGC